MAPIKPLDPYTTQLGFRAPNNASGWRLLASTIPARPDHLVIGDENSWVAPEDVLRVVTERNLECWS